MSLRFASFTVLLAASTLLAGAAVAQQSSTLPEAGIWIDDNGEGAVEIYVCNDRNDRLCGRIVWLKEPLNAQGVPKHDRYNPTESLQSRPICGLPVLGNLAKVSDGGFDNGWIYDPKAGKSYSAAIELQQRDSLVVTGYLGMRFMGKSFTWKRAPASLQRCNTAPAAAQPSNGAKSSPPTNGATAATPPPVKPAPAAAAAATVAPAAAEKDVAAPPATVKQPAASVTVAPATVKPATSAQSATTKPATTQSATTKSATAKSTSTKSTATNAAAAAKPATATAKIDAKTAASRTTAANAPTSKSPTAKTASTGKTTSSTKTAADKSSTKQAKTPAAVATAGTPAPPQKPTAAKPDVASDALSTDPDWATNPLPRP